MIDVRGVSKQYPSGRAGGRVDALSGVSFSMEGGSSAAIYGKSGSGKTTLLNCLGGLERPTSGAIECFGTSIHAVGRRELSLFQRANCGFVFQQGNLLSYLTVEENIGLPLTLNGIEPRERSVRIAMLLERIGLAGAGKAMPSELSGGELQRAAVARAVAHRPKLLLADEPTSHLDTATGKAIIKLIFDMGVESGTTIIFSTHDLDIIGLASVSVHLRDGIRVDDGAGL